jgi:hypothetical protein
MAEEKIKADLAKKKAENGVEKWVINS